MQMQLASTALTVILMLANVVAETSGDINVDLGALADLIYELSSLGNTELNVISDFSSDVASKTDVLAQLQGWRQVPVYAYDLNWVGNYQAHLPPEPCPIFGTGHGGGGDDDEHHDEDEEKHHESEEDHIEPEDHGTGDHNGDLEVSCW